MVRRTFLLQSPPDFDFPRTVHSHGWYSLPPFSADPGGRTMDLILRLPGGTVVDCTCTGRSSGVAVTCESETQLSSHEITAVRSIIRSVLRLDEDLAAFHAAVRREPQYRWMAKNNAGRLLRAPTVFEDLVKMICTTNCTWGLTTVMVSNLVDELGTPGPSGRHAFPDAAAIASCTEAFIRKRIKAGYRSPYLLDLAGSVASGSLNPELWRTAPADPDALLRQLLSIKGVGRYAAENMLRLLGYYRPLALDSWVRTVYSDIYHGGRRVSDRTIARRYARFGDWAGLVLWLEMTRDWHDDKFRRSNGAE